MGAQVRSTSLGARLDVFADVPRLDSRPPFPGGFIRTGALAYGQHFIHSRFRVDGPRRSDGGFWRYVRRGKRTATNRVVDSTLVATPDLNRTGLARYFRAAV